MTANVTASVTAKPAPAKGKLAERVTASVTAKPRIKDWIWRITCQHNERRMTSSNVLSG
nr:MAG TPA: hypothetical protein [Caudoviricetes sp.]